MKQDAVVSMRLSRAVLNELRVVSKREMVPITVIIRAGIRDELRRMNRRWEEEHDA